MRIEHTGYMVEDPPLVAAWYVQHLGFQVARQLPARPFTTFLVDASGHGMIEIYNNPAAHMPNYRAQDPLVLHMAFAVTNGLITAERDRLLAAGATIVSDLTTTASGDQLVMLRDPWGFAIQLVERKEALR
jgi:glyoxylase I family protein